MPRNTRNQKQNDEDTANSDSVNVRNDHLVKLINTVEKLCDRIKSLEEEVYSLKKEKSEILRICNNNHSEMEENKFEEVSMDENRNDSMKSNVIIIAKDRDVQKDERKNRKHTKIMDDASSTGMKETSRNKKVVGKAPINEKSSLLGSNKPQLWLHIYKCKHDTTEENILSYLSNKLPNTTFEVKQLKKNTNSTSFRVNTAYDVQLINELYNENFWPLGVSVQRFKFFRTASSNEESKKTKSFHERKIDDKKQYAENDKL
jgi:hypothetical protein